MFEWLFKYPRSDFSAGELAFESGYPAWLLATLILLAALIIAVSLWRRKAYLSTARLWIVWLLQTAVASLLLGLIWQPVLKTKTLVAGENTVAMLLDHSTSMNYQDEGRSRHQTAMALFENLAPALESNFTLDYGTVGDKLLWHDDLQQLPDHGSRSLLADSVLEALDQARTNPLAAVVIATDGSDNSTLAFDSISSTSVWDQLSTFGVPVHTIGVGREQIAEDSEITGVDLAATTLPGSVERATLTVQHGTADAARIKVYAGDNIVALKDHPLPGTPGQTTIDLDITAGEAGLQDLRFELEPQSDDAMLQNNNRRALLQVKEQERRILYFEGEPRWEYKFIRRAAALSKGQSLVTILRTTPNKFYRQGIESPEQHAEGFPKTKAELYGYDAVIIGNVESISLDADQQQLIHDYVSERGGTLLVLAGNRALADGGWQNSPVAKTLPVTLDTTNSPGFQRIRVKAQLTASGSTSPVTRLDNDPAINSARWNDMPELADFQRTGELKPGAIALLEAGTPSGTFPLLAYQRYGNGNTYMLASSGTWRWQMQLPSDDMRHEIFWQQLLQAISATAESRLTVTTDSQIYLDNSTVGLTARVLDEAFEPMTTATVTANLYAPDGSSQTITLTASAEIAGNYHATLNAVPTGNWQLDVEASQADDPIAGVTRWFSREDDTAESYGLAQNSAFLQRLSQATGGQYFSVSNAAELPAVIRAARNGIVRQQSLPLWNLPFIFLLLLGLKLTEWLLRLVWGRL